MGCRKTADIIYSVTLDNIAPALAEGYQITYPDSTTPADWLQIIPGIASNAGNPATIGWKLYKGVYVPNDGAWHAQATYSGKVPIARLTGGFFCSVTTPWNDSPNSLIEVLGGTVTEFALTLVWFNLPE